MSFRFLTAAATVAASVTIACPAIAELSAQEAVARYRNKDATISLFINGLGTGFSWANVELKGSARDPLFCEPERVALTVDQEVDILSRHIERIPANAPLPLGGTLLFALQEAFPCSKSK